MAFVFFFVVITAFIILLVISHRSKRKRIDNIFLGKVASLERWEYTTEEWKDFSEEYFPWVKNKDLAGIFFILEDTILISNGQDEFFRDLDNNYRLDHIEFLDDSDIFYIKLKKVKSRPRWDTIYYEGHEELRIPLPPGNANRAIRVVKHFQQLAEEKFKALQSPASTDIVFAQFLNKPTDEDESENN